MVYRLTETIACEASGLALDRQGRLYAATAEGVTAFEHGRPWRSWRTAKPALSVAVYSDGQVFAGEEGQVEIFAPDGSLRRTWADADRLGLVTEIRFITGGVLAGDARRRCVRRYDGQLNWVRDIGHENITKGLLIPNGRVSFDVDRRGVLHVCNPGKHRVERYSADGQLLGHIGRFDGIDPEGFPGCCNPTNVALDGAGRLFVTEKAGPRVKALDPAGKLVAVVSTEFDATAKNMDVVVDAGGRVSVAEAARRRIAVFEEAR